MKFITSEENDLVKLIPKLHKNAQLRKKKQITIIEGEHLITAYLQSNVMLSHLVVSEKFYEDNPHFKDKYRAESYSVIKNNLIKKISGLESHQDLIALITLPKEKEKVHYEGLHLYLDNIQDPGNLGSILRTAQSFNVSAVYLSPFSCDAWSPKVLRGSQGCQFNIPIYTRDINELVDKNFQFIVADMKGKGLMNFKFEKTPLIILGNEGDGVSNQIKMHNFSSVSIPMDNSVESLNVGVAAALFCYQYNFQFKG